MSKDSGLNKPEYGGSRDAGWALTSFAAGCTFFAFVVWLTA